MTTMSVPAFVAKWSRSARAERQAAQEHFIDLCRVLGEPTPNEADARGDFYAFEKGATTAMGGQGFADVWKRGHFAWEYKRDRANLTAAYQQVQTHQESLENPPLLVVCDLNRFEVHTNFVNTVKWVYAFDLADLQANVATQTCPIPPLDVLRTAFIAPERLRPAQTTAEVTEAAAAEFAKLAKSLQDRGADPERAAHFLMRLLFCLFSEDINLLPSRLFAKLVENTRFRPTDFDARLRVLFAAMATGGSFGVEYIDNFDGGLFAGSGTLPLTAASTSRAQRS